MELYIYLTVFIVSVAGLLFGTLKYGKKQGIYGYGIGSLLYQWYVKKRPINSVQLQNRRRYEVANKKELIKQIKRDWCRLLGGCVWFVCISSLLGLLSCLAQDSSRENQLKRDSYDGSIMTYEINAKLNDESTQTIPMNVQPKEYSQKQINEFFKNGFEIGFSKVLGENKSFSAITKPLHLIETLEDNPLTLRWWWDDDVIKEDGSICYDAFDGTIQTILYLELTYQSDVRQQAQPIVLKQPIYTKQERLLYALKDRLELIEKEDRWKDSVIVPSKIDGVELSVKSEDSQSWFLLLIVGVPILLYLKMKQDEKDKIESRREQLKIEYPDFIRKLVLYLGAGMTIKQCFSQLYEEECESGTVNKNNYLYMEIGVVVQELKAGVSELQCYEQWGKQLDEICYIKLVTLLTQNLSKGSKGLLLLLKQEMAQALHNRQEYAKQRGEQASTKLLFPMLLLLLVSILVVVVPAFMNFGI